MRRCWRGPIRISSPDSPGGRPRPPRPGWTSPGAEGPHDVPAGDGGAWVLGARHADQWAAVVPICGYGPARTEALGLPPAFHETAADLAAPLARLAVWAFHGEAEDVVPAGASREMEAALRAAGGAPRLTVLPGVGHDAWDTAYRDPELREWLLAQRR